MHPNQKNVTWTRSNAGTGNNTSNYDLIGTRIDRFYISKLICNSITYFETLPCACSDHSFIQITLAADSGIDIGKSYWKLNDQLLDDCNFVRSFELFWQYLTLTKNITLEWWDDIKTQIKLFCIDYSKSKNKQQFRELKHLKKQYSHLNLQSESDLHTYNDIKLKVKNIENNILKGTIIRSKTQTIESNENPTAYFFFKKKHHKANKKQYKQYNTTTTHTITQKIYLPAFDPFIKTFIVKNLLTPL